MDKEKNIKKKFIDSHFELIIVKVNQLIDR